MRAACLGAAVLLSGAAALVYETLWARGLGLVFGSASQAFTVVLVSYMAGLGAGAAVLGPRADRARRPERLYAALEACVGAAALFVPLGLALLGPLYGTIWRAAGSGSAWTTGAQFFGSVVVLGVPTFLMGGTLPAAVAALRGDSGRTTAWLYAFNIAGGVLGALAVTFLLLPRLGHAGTLHVATAVSAAAAIVAAAAPRSSTLSVGEPALSSSLGAPGAPCAALVFSGAGAMLLEVAWHRALVLILGSSLQALTILLATFLFGLAAGSLLARPALRRSTSPPRGLAKVLFGAGLASYAGLFLVPQLPGAFLGLVERTGGWSVGFVAGEFGLCLLVMALPAALLGAALPYAVACIGKRPPGRTVGRLYAWNTVGNVLGAAAAGFLLVPLLGPRNTVLLAVALCLAGALTMLPIWRRVRDAAGWIAGAATFATVLVVSAPSWRSLGVLGGLYKDAHVLLKAYGSSEEVLHAARRQDVLFYRHGAAAAVAVLEKPPVGRRRHLMLAIDGKVDASTGADMSTQILSGHLPFLFVPPRNKFVLVIGHASGITTGSVARHPISRVVSCEIEPAVVEASRLFARYNGDVLADPRVEVIVEDARTYLAYTPEKFDVIISEPSNPWLSGPAKLFTREFLELGRARLAPEGIFCQWIQIYGLKVETLQAFLRTFQDVYPETFGFLTSPGDLILLGSPKPRRIDPRRLSSPEVRGDLARLHLSPLQVLGTFAFGPEECRRIGGNGPRNTDDNALLELRAPEELHLETALRNADHLRRRTLEKYLEGDRIAAAEALLESDRPDLAEPLLAGTEESAEAHYLRARLFLKEDSRLSALDALKEALRLDPAHAGARKLKARLDLEAGRDVVLEETDAEASFLLGLSSLGQAKRTEALSFFQRCVDGDPDVCFPVARFFVSKERFAETLAMLRTRFFRDPENWILREIAESLSWAVPPPDHRRIAELMNRHLLDPVKAFQEGLALYARGDADKALRRFAPLEPLGDPAVSFYEGICLQEIGNGASGKEKLEAFLRDVEGDPNWADAAAYARKVLGCIR